MRRRLIRGSLAGACAALLVAGLCLGGTARAQNLSESQLRVRFLSNFLRFTEWPASTPSSESIPFTVCVLGIADPFDGALHDLQGTHANGRRIDVRSHVNAEQSGSCSLLYVPDSELPRVAGAREAIGSGAVLIVGESEAILDRGGMIALRANGRHLAFVVKLSAARHASLDFSPQMLHAAAEVLP